MTRAPRQTKRIAGTSQLPMGTVKVAKETFVTWTAAIGEPAIMDLEHAHASLATMVSRAKHIPCCQRNNLVTARR